MKKNLIIWSVALASSVIFSSTAQVVNNPQQNPNTDNRNYQKPTETRTDLNNTPNKTDLNKNTQNATYPDSIRPKSIEENTNDQIRMDQNQKDQIINPQNGMDQRNMQNNNGMNTDGSTGQDMNVNGGMMMPDLNSWPEASRMAAQEMMTKYGKPDIMSAEELAWMNKAPWKIICVNKQETRHSFPIEHTDMLKQTITFKVPVEKYDDLARFDGSVIVDRTQGFLSARCDKEANNLLALNLAHDIITGKKTVEVARKAYGDIVKQKMKGGNPEYMQKLMFAPQPNSADPDINTTGLTKPDVMKGMKKEVKMVK